MSERLPTHLLVTALLRRVNDAGGMAMVRASGDRQAGAVLVLIEEGAATRAFERGLGADGAPALIETGPRDSASESLDAYWCRRRLRDPDLWVVELSILHAPRLVAEMLLAH